MRSSRATHPLVLGRRGRAVGQSQRAARRLRAEAEHQCRHRREHAVRRGGRRPGTGAVAPVCFALALAHQEVPERLQVRRPLSRFQHPPARIEALQQRLTLLGSHDQHLAHELGQRRGGPVLPGPGDLAQDRSLPVGLTSEPLGIDPETKRHLARRPVDLAREVADALLEKRAQSLLVRPTGLQREPVLQDGEGQQRKRPAPAAGRARPRCPAGERDSAQSSRALSL